MALGIKQAQAVHVQHKNLWMLPAFNLLVASPLSQAIHTADLLVPSHVGSHLIVS